MPFFSIITVVYNGADTLEETIKSVVSQSFSDYEYLVIDGGSTDGTLDILKNNDDKITRWLSEPDDGIYDAMNKAVRLASGRWILFLGADDVLFSTQTLSKVKDRLLNEFTIYYGNAYFKNRRTFYDGRFSRFKFALRNISHQSIFYPVEIFRKKQFDTRYKLLSDYAFNLELFKLYPFRHIDTCISVFNDGARSSTSTDQAFEAVKLQLVKENLGILPYWYAKGRRVIKKWIGKED